MNKCFLLNTTYLDENNEESYTKELELHNNWDEYRNVYSEPDYQVRPLQMSSKKLVRNQYRNNCENNDDLSIDYNKYRIDYCDTNTHLNIPILKPESYNKNVLTEDSYKVEKPYDCPAVSYNLPVPELYNDEELDDPDVCNPMKDTPDINCKLIDVKPCPALVKGNEVTSPPKPTHRHTYSGTWWVDGPHEAQDHINNELVLQNEIEDAVNSVLQSKLDNNQILKFRHNKSL